MPCRLLLLTLCLLTGLIGCSTSRYDKSEDASKHSLQSNINIKNWQIAGKIGLRSPQTSNSAYLNWHQCDKAFDIRLSGPFGQGAAQLRGDGNGIRLTTPDEEYFASTANQLLEQHLGWPLPIAQLFFWVRGIPDPTSDHQQLTMSHFTQQGWAINILSWQQVKGYQLPKKLKAEHPELKVTLILKNWQPISRCSLD